MGKKEFKKEIPIDEYYCDICGDTIMIRKCYMCRKDLCYKHHINDPRDFGDYPDAYCRPCWDIGEKYRIKMEEIEDKADEECSELQSKWKEECTKQ
jgi:hypothetical protein